MHNRGDTDDRHPYAMYISQEAEQAEVYELAMRLREMIDEYLHTDEGQTNLNTEVERRIAKAKADLEMHTKRVSAGRAAFLPARQPWLGPDCLFAIGNVHCSCMRSHLQLSEMQNIVIEVRKQQLDLAERARRFRAGWDFEEHRSVIRSSQLS